MIMQAVGRDSRRNIGSRINDYAGCGQIPLNVLSRLSEIMQIKHLLTCCHGCKHMSMQAMVKYLPLNVLSPFSIGTQTHDYAGCGQIPVS